MAQDHAIWVAGCMSGTSMDGVDVAMVRTDGQQIFDLGPTAYLPFDPPEQAVIAAAMGQWQDGPEVAAAADVVERKHIEALHQLPKADLIGFHGQTLAHDPANRRTHQAGDGAVLAQATQTPVIWDFRSDDVAMGGHGAPLAPAYHHALIRWAGVAAPVLVLNLGGVGNATLVDPDKSMEDGGIIAFDTGPANAPLNDLMQQHLGQSYDADGALALSGTADRGIVSKTLTHPFFAHPIPKSLDRNAFHDLLDWVKDLELPDALATCVAVISASVNAAQDLLPDSPSRVLVTGGGRKNPAIMQSLTQTLDIPVDPIEAIGADGDMVEAQSFAYLAARVKNKLPTSYPMTTGVAVPMAGGILSRPD